ncbi:molybdopterin-dependent oxidoreductase [Citrobacter sp. Cpo086]|uniref:molybdopterin-dependent oxidoreductase n=1 Tax=Citrobacter sp. Cpo086 TaxID=2985137 RepID=UPI002576698B|nr:molybdopterin-dependent oxidoreductase [Citrobacter sp. Cpo086]MDM2837602.1 molybdopterin-dependent oxidoreductase [Citrobacter sp. Cpo086]
MSNKKEIIQEATQLINRQLTQEGRRRFLKQGLTLGGITMLTGCDITNNANIESSLSQISQLNDRIQEWLFNGNLLAPVYPESMIDTNFPFNAFYSENDAPDINADEYHIEFLGLIKDKQPLTLAHLHQMAQVSQITRHICVEGWSSIGKWGGIPLSTLLKGIGADLHAKYVSFQCADNYYTSIDMATALHPQTILALTWNNEVLPRKYGYPIKVRIPTKLGYKNPKHIQAIEVTNRYPGGYWEDQGYNWFGGS